MNIKNKLFILSLPVFAVALLLPNISEAASCNFTRDLKEGSSGSDVKCLQQYLNNSGYTISKSGVGSSGHETTTLYGLTKSAIKKWQSANGITATGTFGPVSRQKYLSLSNTSTPIISTNNTASTVSITLSKTELQAKISAILAQINKLKDQRDTAVENKQDTKTEAKTSLDDLGPALTDAQSKIDTAYRDGKQVDRSNEYIKDAETKQRDSKRAYNNADYSQSLSLSDEAFELIDNALTKIGITSISKTEARESLDKAKNAITDAENKIETADNQSKAVDNSNNILNQANQKFTEAENYFDNKNYSDAKSRADEVENLVDDAIDAIGESETTEAESAIKNAKGSLDEAKILITNGNYSSAISRLTSAKSSINEARGSLLSKYSDAVDYLTQARDYVTEADNYLDDNSYPNASNSITKALEKLNRALDRF